MNRLARVVAEVKTRFFLASLLLVFFLSFKTDAASFKALSGHVPPGLSRLQSLGELPAERQLSLVLGLPLHDRAALTNFLLHLYTPGSPVYHHYLTPSEFSDQFGPTELEYQSVKSWAAAHRLLIKGTHSNRMLIDVAGSVSDIERTFHIKLLRYQHPKEARTFFAPDIEPTVDVNLPLLSVNGLDDFNLPQPLVRRAELAFEGNGIKPFPLTTNATAGTPWLAAGSGPRSAFIGKDFRAAYAPDVTLDGSGQSVGLFELGGYYPSDILTYETISGLPNVSITNVLVGGFDGSPGPANVEVVLDIDMAIAMAPGLSQVLVYEGTSPLDVLNRMANDDLAKQLSSSWGFGKPLDPTRDQIFQQFAAQGQTMFQASGDDGAYAATAMPPSDNPYITVVGGTSLSTESAGGAWASESAWAGSGGGSSTIYPLPFWQQDLPPSTNQASSTMRNFPDVSCLADGVIWLVANNGQQAKIGGTSAAAPLWAGYAALINQQAAQLQRPALGFMNPALYALGKSGSYATTFHDITAGNNTNGASWTKFFSTSGYDLCTGWGTPAGAKTIAALNGPMPALQIQPEAPFVFAGHSGGPFLPASRVVSLTNNTGGTVNWAAGTTDTWFSLSALSGSLSPNGAVTNLTVVLLPAAAILPTGAHSSTLWFTNLNDGTLQSRTVRLSIAAPSLTAPTVSLEPLYSFSGVDDGAGPNALLEAAPGRFYGTTQSGGTNGAGTFFQFTTSGGLQLLHTLEGLDGATGLGGLALGPDGRFYGSTFQGGSLGNGTVFSAGTNGNFSSLYSFGNTNGSLLFSGLTWRPDGSFYGVTAQGGSYRRGTFFRITTNGVLTTLYEFTGGEDGAFPRGQTVAGPNGLFYGTTYTGGAFGFGSVFCVATNGFLRTLFSFNNMNGAFPNAGLLFASDGNFYGTTTAGGSGNNGTLFRLTPDAQLATLYTFSGPDGTAPWATLTEGTDGGLYGTTIGGGANGNGTVFRITPNGAFTTLAHFNGIDGSQPQAPLFQGADGALYGSTRTGGAYGRGALFRFSFGGPPQIVEQPIAQLAFLGATVQLSVVVSGGSPCSFQWQRQGTNLLEQLNVSGVNTRTLVLNNVSLIDAAQYSVLVTNVFGFANSASVALQLTSSAPAFTTQPASQTAEPGSTAIFIAHATGNQPLHFQWQLNGTNLADHGNVFGSSTDTLIFTNLTEANNATYSVVVTNSLGSLSSTGAVLTVVPVTAPGTRLVTLHAFNGDTDGSAPNGLTFATNGLLYGTTENGGAHLSGTLFSLSTNGIFALLSAFGGTNGSNPNAGLVAASDGNLYGTAPAGGVFNQGTVFRADFGGEITPIFSFASDLAGGAPNAALIQAVDGNLYSTATDGGQGFGTVFQLSLNGVLWTAHSFTNGSDGAFPMAPLVQAADGNFYGVTTNGGTGFGNIFKLTPSGIFTNLYSFTGGPDGSMPNGPLVQGSDGQLHGITAHSTLRGFQFYGSLFKITTNGAFSSVYLLNAGDGAYAAAGLILGDDGNFYGTTHDGGFSGNGTLFQLSPNGTYTALVQFDGFNDGAHPSAPLLQGPDGGIYGSTSSGGPGGNGTVFKLSATSAPQITTQPGNETAQLGGSASFAVAVFGAAPLSYQWRQNGTNLVSGSGVFGATNRVLTLKGLSTVNAGTYSVTVSNQFGGVLSSNATLTIFAPPAFQTIGFTNRTVYLSWSAIPGQVYQPQFKTSLSNPNWINLGTPLSASSTALSTTDPAVTNSQRFYRVVLLSQ